MKIKKLNESSEGFEKAKTVKDFPENTEAGDWLKALLLNADLELENPRILDHYIGKDFADFTLDINGDINRYRIHKGGNVTIKESISESIDVDNEVETIMSSSESYPYRMLNRLQDDFKYLLKANNGVITQNLIDKVLWWKDISKQAEAMRKIYDRMEEKPDWISLDEIDEYERAALSKLSKNESLSESINVETIGDYIVDHYDFDDIDDKYSCINSIKDSFKGQETISEEELEQFIGAHNGKDKENLEESDDRRKYENEFYDLNDKLAAAAIECGGDADDFKGDVKGNGFSIVFTSAVDKKNRKAFEKNIESAIEKSLADTRFGDWINTYVYKLNEQQVERNVPKELVKEIMDKCDIYEIQVDGRCMEDLSEDTRGQGKYSDKFYDYASYLEQNNMNGDGWYLINQLIRYCKEDDLKDLWIERMGSVAEKAGYGDSKDINEQLNEDIEIEPKRGPEEGPLFGLASMLNTAIQEELKTIDNYNSIAVTAKDCDAEYMIDVINDINTEENKHVGQLQQLLQMISPNAEAIRTGIRETEDTTGWYYNDDEMEMPYQYQ